jgi:hypothetical protein
MNAEAQWLRILNVFKFWRDRINFTD